MQHELEKQENDPTYVPKAKHYDIEEVSNFRKWLRALCSWEFFVEFFALMIHPLPYLDMKCPMSMLNLLSTKDGDITVDYYLSDFLFALMFLRIFFIIRTLMTFSVYSAQHSKRVAKKY
jgi:hypothetical protein